MAALLAQLVTSEAFKISVLEWESISSSGEVETFARGVLLSQSLSKKSGYEQLKSLQKLFLHLPFPHKSLFLGRFFKLLSEFPIPSDIYKETQICLLITEILKSISTEFDGKIGEIVLNLAVSALISLIKSIKNPDSVKMIKSGIEEKVSLLGKTVLMSLSSEDTAFLSGNCENKAMDWQHLRVKHILDICLSHAPTLLLPLLLTTIKLSPNSSALTPLLPDYFPANHLPSSPKKTQEKPLSMLQGLKWLHGKVLSEVQNGLKSDFDQVTFELNLLLSGDGIRIKKSGKQDLFEAFDELMVIGKASRETVSCWKVLVKCFGKLYVLQEVEWQALQEKLTRLTDRNQYLRDIGKKKPARIKKTQDTTGKVDRKKAGLQKRRIPG